jgi:2,5-dihydroxypyridine 5,6-dioxygenase
VLQVRCCGKIRLIISSKGATALILGERLDAFTSVLGLCAIKKGDTVCVLHEAGSRRELVELGFLAAQSLGAAVFQIGLVGASAANPTPIRSTGASAAIAGIAPVVGALASSTLVLDCTVEGLLHASELPAILRGGARVLMVSNEHPEALVRLLPKTADEAPVREAMKALRASRWMRVSSKAGTDLTVQLQDGDDKSAVGGVWGWASKPGQIAHWPGGLVLAFPRKNSVNGILVLDQGDVNLSFKDYLRDAVKLTIAQDYVTEINGGFEAERLKETWSIWQEIEGANHCKAVSHVGWGLNRQARWDSMGYYDKQDFNGTELRAFAGNFLYSTGANESAGRHTQGHFDLPLRGCTIEIEAGIVVRDGQLVT